MKRTGYNSQMETKIDSLRSAAFLLVGFFARARVSILAIIVASAVAVGLAACGGGGGDGVGNVGNGTPPPSPPNLNPMAYFHGAERVAGLQYQYEDGSNGETDARGDFPIEQGKTVVFSIGNTEIGTMTVRFDAQNEIVTPLHIGDENRAIKIEQLLIALDTDTGPALIDLREIEEGDTDDLFGIQRLGGDERTFTLSSSGRTITIMSATKASVALKKTNNCAYSGVFAGSLSDAGDAVAVALMPNIGELTVPGVVDLSNASPAISFIRDKDGNVEVGEAFLTIDLKIPPLVAALKIEGGGTGTITLASYDRIEFGDGTVFGTVRRVAGNPNADYRLVGVYDDDDDDGAFVADIYDGSDGSDGGSAEIFYINDPRVQNLSPARWDGVFPTSGTTDLILQVGADSATLTLFADSNIFLGADDKIGGSWCEL